MPCTAHLEPFSTPTCTLTPKYVQANHPELLRSKEYRRDVKSHYDESHRFNEDQKCHRTQAELSPWIIDFVYGTCLREAFPIEMTVLLSCPEAGHILKMALNILEERPEGPLCNDRLMRRFLWDRKRFATSQSLNSTYMCSTFGYECH